MTLNAKVVQALWQQFATLSNTPIDEKGYVTHAADNLLTGVDFEALEADYTQGSGNELAGKFRAVHSSAALVANNFGPWKQTPAKMWLCGYTEFQTLTFEAKCPTGLKGTPPNLDALLEGESIVIGVESKFTEYLRPKVPFFPPSYRRENLPLIEDAWWEILTATRSEEKKQHLDVAQLIKHYLGLRRHTVNSQQNAILLYLFWEPTNWADFEIFQQHRAEITKFASQVADTTLQFEAQSYLELWQTWTKQLARPYQSHLDAVRSRYEVTIQ